MEFSEWEPVYLEIIEDFGFSKGDDEKSAQVLAELCKERKVTSPECLGISGEATVCGCGYNLEDDLEKYGVKGKLIAADGSVSRINTQPDIIVTDLDGCIQKEIEANADGSVAVIHGHGDNIDLLKKYVPRFEGLILPTVQCRPPEGLFNFGGFTDGDRAVVLAKSLGAEKIHLRGFDFSNPYIKSGKDPEIKRKKLLWAKRIIEAVSPESLNL